MGLKDETLFFAGGTELNEPAAIPDQTITAMDVMIAAIKSDTPVDETTMNQLRALIGAADRDLAQPVLEERVSNTREVLEEAREEFFECREKRNEFTFGFERIREMGAQGPGRGIRLFGRYVAHDGDTRTYFVYPRDLAIHKLPYQLRNLIQRCTIG